jgi:transcriptional regulator with XRE-family HTH domain
MHTEISILINQYGVTRTAIADRVGCSLPYVSLVLNGKRNDKMNIFKTALDLVEEVKQREEENRQRLDALLQCEAA